MVSQFKIVLKKYILFTGSCNHPNNYKISRDLIDFEGFRLSRDMKRLTLLGYSIPLMDEFC